ncbi:MAG: DUF1800 family protein [Chitinophagales bacterium]
MKREDFVKILLVAPFILNSVSCENKQTDSSLKTKSKIKKKEDNISDEELAFLLRRTTFGFSNKDFEFCKKIGLKKTIDLLLQDHPAPPHPVNYEYTQDPYTPIGTTWVDKPYSETIFFTEYRKKSFESWVFKGICQEPKVSIREQMTLFWHNHFGLSSVMDYKYEYKHDELLRKNALGNYKELTKEVTIDPAMLRFLSGNGNNRDAPNENYARELLELYTIGRGKQISVGNYTNYTEEDVRVLSKALTGWTDVGWYNNYTHIPIKAKFKILAHDPVPLRLSDAFDNKIIYPTFGRRYKDVIDIIFSYTETSKFICRKLYRWFVDCNIDDIIEQNIIVPLSNTLIINDFELKPVIKQLISSQHFFDQIKSTSKTKNPPEYIGNILKFFPFKISDNLELEYHFWYQIFNESVSMGLDYLKPPSVAGWKAYYQSPSYYNSWINAATLNNKQKFCNKFFIQGFTYKDDCVKIDIKSWLREYAENLALGDIIKDLNKKLFVIEFDKKRIEQIKNIFLNGYNESHWSIEAQRYITESNKSTSLNQFESNCRNGLKYMFTAPEFHLI